jgi:two-component system, chemotaxis family, response regulator Rcp1
MTIVRTDRAPIEVLLVDDNPGDVRLAQEAFREMVGVMTLHVASDGVEALSFLRREGPHANSPRPDLILLDLDMPRMNGPETLAKIRSDASLKLIPVVILTTSAAEADIVKSYELNANLYLTKPVGLDAIAILVKSINNFAWLGQCRISVLPP